MPTNNVEEIYVKKPVQCLMKKSFSRWEAQLVLLFSEYNVILFNSYFFAYFQQKYEAFCT